MYSLIEANLENQVNMGKENSHILFLLSCNDNKKNEILITMFGWRC